MSEKLLTEIRDLLRERLPSPDYEAPAHRDVGRGRAANSEPAREEPGEDEGFENNDAMVREYDREKDAEIRHLRSELAESERIRMEAASEIVRLRAERDDLAERMVGVPQRIHSLTDIQEDLAGKLVDAERERDAEIARLRAALNYADGALASIHGAPSSTSHEEIRARALSGRAYVARALSGAKPGEDTHTGGDDDEG